MEKIPERNAYFPRCNSLKKKKNNNMVGEIKSLSKQINV